MKIFLKSILSLSIRFISRLYLFKYFILFIQHYASENIRKIKVRNIDFFFINKNLITNYRIDTFLTKEPETIKWIDSFKLNSNFWDIGANIGLYSIYSAKTKGCNVVSFEPSLNNLEVLSKNINLNKLSEKVLIAPIALTKVIGPEFLFCSSKLEGSAHSSFGYEIDQKGLKLNSILKYKTLGFTADEFSKIFSLPSPEYLKIDVDGIEELILEGSSDLLKKVKEILIEVNTDNLEQTSLIHNILINKQFYLYKDYYNNKIKQGNQIWKKNEQNN